MSMLFWLGENTNLPSQLLNLFGVNEDMKNEIMYCSANVVKNS
jgi:hypothetical protein